MQPSAAFLLLLTLLIISCATNDQDRERVTDTGISSADTTLQADTLQSGNQSSSFDSDTMTIDREAAVFYQPDSLQMEKRMKEVGEEDFRAGAGDYIYYINLSAEYLEKEGLPVLDAQNKKYLKFVSANKYVQVIRLDSLEELWGLYLFNPKKKAYAPDMTMIEDEYKSYFK